MERMFSAMLTSPAKIDDEVKGPGETVIVSQGILLQLLDAHNVDKLSVMVLFDPDADPAGDVLSSNAALIEAEVSTRVTIIRAAVESEIETIRSQADQRVAKAETDANERVALIEAAATARIEKVEADAAANIAAATTPPDLIKPTVKPKPK